MDERKSVHIVTHTELFNVFKGSLVWSLALDSALQDNAQVCWEKGNLKMCTALKLLTTNLMDQYFQLREFFFHKYNEAFLKGGICQNAAVQSHK